VAAALYLATPSRQAFSARALSLQIHLFKTPIRENKYASFKWHLSHSLGAASLSLPQNSFINLISRPGW